MTAQIFVKEHSFYKRILQIGMPIAIQNMVTVGINMLDSVMLGGMGEYQLSAASLGSQFFNFYHIVLMGISMGASVLLSRFWGEKDLPSFRRMVTLMIRISLLVALLFTAANCLFPEWVMRSYTNDPQIIAYGIRYLSAVGFTYILHSLTLCCTVVLRCVGKVQLALYGSIASLVVKILFNWIFIFGKLGAPRLEIMGAGIGTLVARLIEFTLICGFFFFAEKEISYRLRHLLQKCTDMLQTYIRVGLPVFCSDSMLALGNNVVSMVMGRIGAGFVSAYAITAMILQLATVFIMGMAHASSVQIGHAIGAGKQEEVQKMGHTFLLIAAGMGLLGGAFIWGVSAPVIEFYNIAPETKAIAAELMKAVAGMLVFQSIGTVMTKGVLRGGGDTRFLMIADIAFLWLASVPLGYLAGLVWEFPPFWTMICLRIDNVMKSVFCIWRLLGRKWIKALR